MIRDACAGRVTEIPCDPQFIYHYVHIDDVAEALIVGLEAEALPAREYNVGSAQALTMSRRSPATRFPAERSGSRRVRTMSPTCRRRSTFRASRATSAGARGSTSPAASNPIGRRSRPVAPRHRSPRLAREQKRLDALFE
jgi:nucleoside-diphosphate-sugar epimerase